MNNSTIFIKGKIVPTIKIKGKTNASIIRIYPELENIEITPKVEDQEFQSDMYGYDKVKVKGVQSYIDEDIKPEYIKEGVDILGVVGNVVELKGEEKVITPKTTTQTIIPSDGKNGITKITVQPVDRTIDEDIKPENIIDGVEILGVVGNYKGIDTSDATVTPDKVLAGTTVYINNEKIEGTLPNNGELEFTPSDELQIVPEGYTSGGIVSAADITALNEYNACLTLANSIENLEDYRDTTATAEDIREGKTAYSNGEKITGTMKSEGGLVVSSTEPTGKDRKSIWLKSSKNLLDTSKFPQKTSYGITTRVDEDGTITLNGKSTSTNNHIVMEYKLPQELLNEWVTFGFESTEDLNTAATQIYPGLKNSSKGNLTSAWILYEGVSRIREIQVTQDMIDNSYYFGVYIANGITLNNSKFTIIIYPRKI